MTSASDHQAPSGSGASADGSSAAGPAKAAQRPPRAPSSDRSSTGSGRSEGGAPAAGQPAGPPGAEEQVAEAGAVEPAGHPLELLQQQLPPRAGGGAAPAPAPAPSAPPPGSTSPGPGRSLSFTFGSLSPMGSPAKPPGFGSPGQLAPPPFAAAAALAGPGSPAAARQLQQPLMPPSPSRPPGLASPRSVRLTGSVRLVGDTIIPLPSGHSLPPVPPLAGTANSPGQGAARQLPFAAGAGGAAGLQVRGGTGRRRRGQSDQQAACSLHFIVAKPGNAGLCCS